METARTWPYRGQESDGAVPGRVYYGRPGRDGTEAEIAARIPRRRVLAVLREYGWTVARAYRGSHWRHAGGGRLYVPSGAFPLHDEYRMSIARAMAAADGSAPWVILDVMGIDYAPAKG